MDKTCKSCGQTLPLDAFYKHKQMADGRLNRCKQCVKSRVKRHRHENIDKIREYDRNRPNQAERIKKNREWQSRNRTNTAQRKAEWITRNHLKRKAHSQVRQAIKSGRLKKEPCAICGSLDSEAHHEDYLRPLWVIWLCDEHHKLWHKVDREVKRRWECETKDCSK